MRSPNKSLPLGERASGVLRSLRKLRGDDPPEKLLDVRQRVELQVLLDPVGHQRRANSDQELLVRAEHLAAMVGDDRVVIATGDLGMQLRATSRRLGCFSMPERLRLPMKSA